MYESDLISIFRDGSKNCQNCPLHSIIIESNGELIRHSLKKQDHLFFILYYLKLVERED